MLKLCLLGLLIVEQRLLLALLLFQLGFLRGDLFARLLQLRDRLLTRLVQIAKVGLQALAALALFAAEDQLESGMFTLAECGIKLCGKVALLRIALALQLAIDAFISSICLFNWARVFCVSRSLRVAAEMASSCCLSWASRAARCCCCWRTARSLAAISA